MAVAAKKTKVVAPAEPSVPTAPLAYVDQIGHAAGAIWHTLNGNGPQTLVKLAQLLKDHPKDVVLHAVGWLAREGKLDVIETGRTRKFGLK